MSVGKQPVGQSRCPVPKPKIGSVLPGVARREGRGHIFGAFKAGWPSCAVHCLDGANGASIVKELACQMSWVCMSFWSVLRSW